MLFRWQCLKFNALSVNVQPSLPLLCCSSSVTSRVLAGGVFVDVTDEAEVGYLQWTPPKEWIKHVPEVMTGGAAVADFDNDGWDRLARDSL
jgi:hypothetical protein